MKAHLRSLAFASILCAALVAQDGAKALWIDVPFVAQPAEGCGAASIAMVMQYWEQQQGKPPSPAAGADQILRALHDGAAHGIYARDMVNYFQQNGFRTFAFAGEWPDLQRHLAKGRPLIVALQPGPDRPLHFVVVAGLDPAQQLVLLNDPAQRKLLKEEDARFAKEWTAAGNWTLLAVPEASAHP
ncbi:MAG TPA: C39 family peptidase [Terracidiphilus sp.]|nr:C39 family peptidase [Terracidiphilus sp.]